MNDKELINYLLEDENLINEFEDYLKESNKEIAMNWIINDENIYNYLATLPITSEETKSKFYEILDNYCCQIPF